MAKQEQARKRYLSDLTDEQWEILEPMLPPPRTQHGGAPRQVDLRAVLDTLLYQNRTGRQWDMLPHDLLPKSTGYDYFAQWRDDGTWAKIIRRLRTRVRVHVWIFSVTNGPRIRNGETGFGIGISLSNVNRLGYHFER